MPLTAHLLPPPTQISVDETNGEKHNDCTSAPSGLNESGVNNCLQNLVSYTIVLFLCDLYHGSYLHLSMNYDRHGRHVGLLI